MPQGRPTQIGHVLAVECAWRPRRTKLASVLVLVLIILLLALGGGIFITPFLFMLVVFAVIVFLMGR